MRKIVVDLVLDTQSGEARVVVDYHDPSLSTLELNEAIREGEIREQVLGAVGRVLGEPVAEAVRSGALDLVCLDDHPELRGRVEDGAPGGERDGEPAPLRSGR